MDEPDASLSLQHPTHRRRTRSGDVRSPYALSLAAVTPTDDHNVSKYVELWIQVENLVLPKHLQENDMISTARATLGVLRHRVTDKLQAWCKVGETPDVAVTGHGPLGHSINWKDPVQIRMANKEQIVNFGVYINYDKVGELRLSLRRLLDANDGSTRVTTHVLPKLGNVTPGPETPPLHAARLSVGAQTRLIISARMRTSSRFCLPGLKPALTVLNCPIEKLRIYVPGQDKPCKLLPAQEKAIRLFRDKEHHNKYIYYSLATGQLYYISKNLDKMEIFYDEQKINRLLALSLNVMRFIFLLKKKTRTYTFAALRFPSIGLTTPRFDQVATRLWDNSIGQQLLADDDAMPTSDRRKKSVEGAQKQNRKAVEKHFRSRRRTYSQKIPEETLSLQFIPRLSENDINELDDLPNTMYSSKMAKELKTVWKRFIDFIHDWRKEEDKQLTQLLKDRNGESRRRGRRKTSENRKLVSPVTNIYINDAMRTKLFDAMQDIVERKESKSYSALQKVIDEAATVIPFDDPLLKIARQQRLELWEYTQYTKSLFLLGYVTINLRKLCKFIIPSYKALSRDQISAHGAFHRICVKVGWTRHLLKLSEEVLRYTYLGITNVNTAKRLMTLRKMRKHIQQLELGAPAKYVNSLPEPQPLMIDKTTGEVVRSPLDRLGRQMEAEIKCGSRLSAGIILQQFAEIQAAMSLAYNWQKFICKSQSFLKFIKRVVFTSAQLMKLLKWVEQETQAATPEPMTPTAVAAPDSTHRRNDSLFEHTVTDLVASIRLHTTNSVRLDRRAAPLIPDPGAVHLRSLSAPVIAPTPTDELDLSSDDDSGDPTLKPLAGDYELEAITPFHLHKDAMLVIHGMWDKHFKHVTPLQLFICAFPHHPEGMLRLLGAACDYHAFAEIRKMYVDAQLQFGQRLFSTIKYLTHQSSREKYRMMIREGIMTDCMGKPFDTGQNYANHAGHGYAIIVFHKKLGMYVASHVQYRFHHSSFLAGNPVHFAGEIRAVKGQVVAITSKSGHYKPNPRQGLTFLRWLRDQGLDMTTIEYREVTANGTVTMSAIAQLHAYEQAETANNLTFRFYQFQLSSAGLESKSSDHDESSSSIASDQQSPRPKARPKKSDPKPPPARYPIRACELKQALIYARITASKQLATSSGRELLRKLATRSHGGNLDEARQAYLARVQQGVVSRAEISNKKPPPEKPKVTLQKLLDSQYTTRSQPRREAAAAAAAKALETYTGGSDVETRHPSAILIPKHEVAAAGAAAARQRMVSYEWATPSDYGPSSARAGDNIAPTTRHSQLAKEMSYEWAVASDYIPTDAATAGPTAQPTVGASVSAGVSAGDNIASTAPHTRETSYEWPVGSDYIPTVASAASARANAGANTGANIAPKSPHTRETSYEWVVGSDYGPSTARAGDNTASTTQHTRMPSYEWAVESDFIPAVAAAAQPTVGVSVSAAASANSDFKEEGRPREASYDWSTE